MGTKRLNKLGAITTAAAATVTFLATASPAQAGKPSGGGKPPGGGGSTSSLQLVVLTGGDSVPNWGEDVTFNVSTTATTQPYVDLVCSQGGTVVYSATSGFYASYPWPWTQTMNLASQSWTGGSAACTGTLYMFAGKGKTVLATLPFTAAA